MSGKTLYKCPKGTIDIALATYEQLKFVKEQLETVFICYGGKPLETPVFERHDVLMGKYGEEADTKLIYELAETGGEHLALRYDHTLPFVRYVIENSITKMRRYTIGRVYRRDQPSTARFREFYQADFDILGEDSQSMLTEATIFKLIYEGLAAIGLGPNDFTIYYNYTGNLRAILDAVGVSDINFKAACAIIDKLDKQPFDELIAEFTKYIDADKLPELRRLLTNNTILDSTSAASDVLLKEATDAWRCPATFMPSLARGLDYYNGLIFEVKLRNGVSTASVVSGGRYDGLVPGNTLIGVSFGISRIMSLMTIRIPDRLEQRVFVTTLGSVSRTDKLAVIEWARSKWPIVLYDTSDKQRKLGKVLAECEGYSYVVIVAEKEWADRTVIVKNLAERTQEIVSCCCAS